MRSGFWSRWCWRWLPQPVQVVTAEVEYVDISETDRQDGQARVRVRERYMAAALLAGTLLRIGLKSGEAVTVGAAVASILPNPAALLDVRTREDAEQLVGAPEAQEARAQPWCAGTEQAQARIDADRIACPGHPGCTHAQPVRAR